MKTTTTQRTVNKGLFDVVVAKVVFYAGVLALEALVVAGAGTNGCLPGHRHEPLHASIALARQVGQGPAVDCCGTGLGGDAIYPQRTVRWHPHPTTRWLP